MRVIAGTARSVPLKAPAGMETRPTTDKIKETLFNILQFELQDAVFLDLFAGSGAIGIEALSRGAAKAVFVDQARAAVDCISENLKKCRFTEKSRVIRCDAASAAAYVRSAVPEQDGRLIIFMDPPYGRGLEEPVLKELLTQGLVGGDTLIIIEEALETDMGFVESLGLEICRVKEYKNQKHVFIKKR